MNIGLVTVPQTILEGVIMGSSDTRRKSRWWSSRESRFIRGFHRRWRHRPTLRCAAAAAFLSRIPAAQTPGGESGAGLRALVRGGWLSGCLEPASGSGLPQTQHLPALDRGQLPEK